MPTTAQIDSYLTELDSDGVQLRLPELLRYRSLTSGIKLQAGQRTMNLQSGGERSLFKGRGMEFDEARIYQPGDDIRSIDWRVTARTGKTHTKVFREERERPVFVYADVSNSMHFGTELLFKSVQVAHIAALLGFAAAKRGDKFGAVIFNQRQDAEIKPGARQRAVLAVLDQLVSLHQILPNDTESNCALNALSRLRYIAKPGTLVYLLSDFSQYTTAHFDILGMMTRHCEVIAVQVHDRFEFDLPSATAKQALNVTDGLSQHVIHLNNEQTVTNYHQRAKQRQLTLNQAFSSAGVSFRGVSAGLPLTEQFILSKHGYLVGQSL